MKRYVCAVLAFILLASALGCAKKETVPARGVWEGRTYTNTEAGIKLTVPEGYYIYSDEELCKWAGVSADTYDNVKNSQGYTDFLIGSETSSMYIVYQLIGIKNLDAEQYYNLTTAKNKTRKISGEERNVVFESLSEKTLCGQDYYYFGYTIEGVDDFYGAYVFKFFSETLMTYLNIEGNSQDQVNACLTFFDTAGVIE